MLASGTTLCSDPGGCENCRPLAQAEGSGPAALVLAINALDALLIEDGSTYRMAYRE